jgi:hypothetical protein
MTWLLLRTPAGTAAVEHMNEAIRLDVGQKFEKKVEVPSWL